MPLTLEPPVPYNLHEFICAYLYMYTCAYKCSPPPPLAPPAWAVRRTCEVLPLHFAKFATGVTSYVTAPAISTLHIALFTSCSRVAAVLGVCSFVGAQKPGEQGGCIFLTVKAIGNEP